MDDVALSPPIWMQNETYPARVDRQIITSIWNEGVIDRDGGDFEVTERGAGATMTVDIAAGKGIVDGDDQANQGAYLIESTAVENIVVSAPHLTLDRIDAVVAQIRDPNAGGAAGDDFIFAMVDGTASASPAAPAIPDSALLLAYVLVSNGDTAVVDSMITDMRALAVPRAPTAPVGTVEMYAGTSTPDGYLPCDGSNVSRVTYASLFAALGTTWGAGNGTTTFGLPDFRDRFPFGAGGTKSVGDSGGAATVGLITANLPSHTHSFTTSSDGAHTHTLGVASTTTIDSNVLGRNAFGANASEVTDSNGAHTHSGTTGATGSGTAFSILPSYRAVAFIIKAF